MRINAIDTKWTLSVMSEPGRGGKPDSGATGSGASVDCEDEEKPDTGVSELGGCPETTTDQPDEDQSSCDDGGGE